MFDTTTLKAIAAALTHAARVANAKADQHAAAEEHTDAGKQLARAKRNLDWAAEQRRAIRFLEECNDAKPTDFFAKFWAAYPARRKTNKPGCLRIWNARKLDRRAAEIMLGLERCRRSLDWTKEGGDFIPGPAVWLRREGWTDQLATAQQARPDPRKETVIADPPRWTDFLKEKALRFMPFSGAPKHWHNEFAQWERANGF